MDGHAVVGIEDLARCPPAKQCAAGVLGRSTTGAGQGDGSVAGTFADCRSFLRVHVEPEPTAATAAGD